MLIGDQGMEFIANTIEQNNLTVTTLTLNKNQIGSQGAQFLANSLKENSRRQMVLL